MRTVHAVPPCPAVELPTALGWISVAVPFWHVAPRSNTALEPVNLANASCGPLLCTVTWYPSAGTALVSATAFPWHVTVIEPPAFEKVVAADPGVTDVDVCVVVVVVFPGVGVTVEVTGVVIVVVVTAAGVWRAVGNVDVVGAAAAWPRKAEVPGMVDGPVRWVGEGDVDVVGTLQVLTALRPAGDDVALLATLGGGMTGSGGEAIALVTAPTPTQLTTVAAAVATTQAAIGSAVTRRIQRFSPLQQEVRTKAVIIRRPQSSSTCLPSQDRLLRNDTSHRPVTSQRPGGASMTGFIGRCES